MHLDLLPCRHAWWHSHHNLLPGMVDEELLTRLDARRHLYGKEWHAPALRFLAAGIVSCNFEMKTVDSPQIAPRQQGGSKLLSPTARAVRAPRASTERPLRDDRRRP